MLMPVRPDPRRLARRSVLRASALTRLAVTGTISGLLWLWAAATLGWLA